MSASSCPEPTDSLLNGGDYHPQGIASTPTPGAGRSRSPSSRSILPANRRGDALALMQSSCNPHWRHSSITDCSQCRERKSSVRSAPPADSQPPARGRCPQNPRPAWRRVLGEHDDRRCQLGLLATDPFHPVDPRQPHCPELQTDWPWPPARATGKSQASGSYLENRS